MKFYNVHPQLKGTFFYKWMNEKVLYSWNDKVPYSSKFLIVWPSTQITSEEIILNAANSIAIRMIDRLA